MTKPNLILPFSKLKKFCEDMILIQIIILVVVNSLFFPGVIYVQALNYSEFQQSQSDYENEIQLEYGVPTLLSEVSVPSSTIFGGSIITGFYIKANFSNNNGSIWINNQNEEKIWVDYLNNSIEKFLDVNNTSIKKYSLWANSSTLGNNTLIFTFRAEMIHLDNFGLVVLVVFIIFIPIVIIVIIIVEKGRTKDSHSVRIAKKVGERLAVKLENKYKGKFIKLFGDKPIIKKVNVCPKCGIMITFVNDNFCKNCGFQLRE